MNKNTSFNSNCKVIVVLPVPVFGCFKSTVYGVFFITQFKKNKKNNYVIEACLHGLFPAVHTYSHTIPHLIYASLLATGERSKALQLANFMLTYGMLEMTCFYEQEVINHDDLMSFDCLVSTL